MAGRRRISSESGNQIRERKPTSIETREQRIIGLAMDAAEEKIRNGTASSQIICHFLNLGTEKAKLEREKIQYETELLKSKKNYMDADRRTEELIEQAINAMKRYSGNGGN